MFLLNSELTGIVAEVKYGNAQLDLKCRRIKIDLPEGAVPAFMTVSGDFDVEYRIIIATRTGRIYSIKNGQVSGDDSSTVGRSRLIP